MAGEGDGASGMRAVVEDPYDLARFVEAQERVLADVEAELAAGRKESHWMWFVFPQIAGLGFSPMSMLYGISGRREAAAYLAHPELGPRMRALTTTLLGHADKSALVIFGTPDDLKFRSSMTLFDAVAPGEVFAEALAAFFGGEPDPATVGRLRALANPGGGSEGVVGAGDVVRPGWLARFWRGLGRRS